MVENKDNLKVGDKFVITSKIESIDGKYGIVTAIDDDGFKRFPIIADVRDGGKDVILGFDEVAKVYKRSEWVFGRLGESGLNPDDMVFLGGYSETAPSNPVPALVSSIRESVTLWYIFAGKSPDLTYVPPQPIQPVEPEKVKINIWTITIFPPDEEAKDWNAILTNEKDGSSIVILHIKSKEDIENRVMDMLENYCVNH